MIKVLKENRSHVDFTPLKTREDLAEYMHSYGFFLNNHHVGDDISDALQYYNTCLAVCDEIAKKLIQWHGKQIEHKYLIGLASMMLNPRTDNEHNNEPVQTLVKDLIEEFELENIEAVKEYLEDWDIIYSIDNM